MTETKYVHYTTQAMETERSCTDQLGVAAADDIVLKRSAGSRVPLPFAGHKGGQFV